MNNIFKTKDNHICLSGPVQFETVQSMYKGMLQLFKGQSELVLDMAQVSQCDSACLALIVALIRYAKQKNVKLQFKGMPQQLRNLIRVGGLDLIMPSVID